MDWFVAVFIGFVQSYVLMPVIWAGLYVLWTIFTNCSEEVRCTVRERFHEPSPDKMPASKWSSPKARIEARNALRDTKKDQKEDAKKDSKDQNAVNPEGGDADQKEDAKKDSKDESAVKYTSV